jgi:hypothetical protein
MVLTVALAESLPVLLFSSLSPPCGSFGMHEHDPARRNLSINHVLAPQNRLRQAHAADGTASASGGCGFRCKGDAALDSFVHSIVAGAMDIEELAAQGVRRAVCPYYASRAAVLQADVVLVPYNCLIHRCAHPVKLPACASRA